jgi:hypothetical protein
LNTHSLQSFARRIQWWRAIDVAIGYIAGQLMCRWWP